MAVVRFAFIFALLACTYIVLAVADDDDTTTSDTTASDDTTTPESTTSPTPTPSPDRSFSIISSTAPNTQFEWDAVQCLSEAFILHPDRVTETFGELYDYKHSGIWRVNSGCTSLYVPHENVTIVLRVTEGSEETHFILYN